MSDQNHNSRSKDLRIGNWMLIPETDTMYAHYSKVVSISSSEIRVSLDDNYGMGISWDSISPIPLTADLLLKAGFEETSKTKSFQKLLADSLQFIYLTYSEGKIIFSIVDRYDIKEKVMTIISLDNLEFVHQLQNAYYILTGDELEIDLSKSELSLGSNVGPAPSPSNLFDSMKTNVDAIVEATFGKKK